MPATKRKNPHAVALGRRGGLSKALRKRIAAQQNGKLGGRPPKETVVSKQEIGARLRAIREAREMTQGELAQLIGIRNSNVSDIERGTRGLTLNQVARLAQALSIPTADLLEDPKTKKANGSKKNGILPSRFERIKTLPRAKQQAINEMIDFYLARHAS